MEFLKLEELFEKLENKRLSKDNLEIRDHMKISDVYVVIVHMIRI